MANFKSRIWKYFKVSSDNETTAECQLCREQSLSSKIIRGKTPKLFSTKPLWNHVKHKHPSVVTVYKSQTENKVDTTDTSNTTEKCISESDADLDVDNPDENFCSQEQHNTHTHKQKQHQPTLQMTINRNKQWNINDPKAKAISHKICEMMTLDAEPFALVEREGFSKLLKYIVPRYNLPSRTYFSRTLMPEIYKEIRSQVEAKLCTAKYISFTTDIWTSSVNNESLSLTAHYISADTFKKEIYNFDS